MAAKTGAARTRPAARSRASISLPSGRAAASMLPMASSKLIILLLFAAGRLTSTAPSRAAAAAARTSRRERLAYPEAAKRENSNGLVHRANRGDERSGGRASEGAGEAARTRGDR